MLLINPTGSQRFGSEKNYVLYSPPWSAIINRVNVGIISLEKAGILWLGRGVEVKGGIDK